MEDDRHAGSEGLQGQLGDVDFVNDDPPCEGKRCFREPKGFSTDRGPDVLPSNMSTMRKKAKEKEDLPLPVLPQIPTCQQTRLNHMHSRQIYPRSVTFCPGLMCALTFLSTGFSVASYRTLRFWILISPCWGQPLGT